MPSYNQLRRAYGLDTECSFRSITGEADGGVPGRSGVDPGRRDQRPGQPGLRGALRRRRQRDRPRQRGGRGIGGTGRASDHTGRSTQGHLRLGEQCGRVHRRWSPSGTCRGTEFGELQLAIWKAQFEALRDGDRFFYRNDPGLSLIRRHLGIDYRRNLGDIIALNTDIPRDELAENVFRIQPEEEEAAGAGSGASGGTTAEAPPDSTSSGPDDVPAVTSGRAGRVGRPPRPPPTIARSPMITV